ncbi:translation initiation factor 1A [Methanocella paludicola SANAE]|uniref:Translation initiation factor 1A n=1 Tax=Methanocella paludicola (strain DSM 17711 / JCM 13418 / NBRC 101707 / SANAE) TaxID=304371 RepID=D1Z0M2_METPS|nr:translation initiation factor eIF-1A [Methanocella paludicola]BAI62244.1 translation initiation factor 1A [Methanocella paludicola SANAE]
MYKPHNKGGKKPVNTGGEVIRVRTPRKADGEILGTVTKMLGAYHLSVLCLDNLTRMCRIKGKMKKRTWVREGDTVIVVPWSFQDEKADVIWRYTGPQAGWLKRKGFLDSNTI